MYQLNLGNLELRLFGVLIVSSEICGFDGFFRDLWF